MGDQDQLNTSKEISAGNVENKERNGELSAQVLLGGVTISKQETGNPPPPPSYCNII